MIIGHGMNLEVRTEMGPLDLLYLGIAVIVAVIAFCFLFVKFGLPEKKGEQIKRIAKQAATMALEAGVSKLLLTHFKPEEDPDNYVSEAMEVFPNTLAAIEGLNLRI